MTILRAMETDHLHGNNLALATYLNHNAPADTPLSTVGWLAGLDPNDLGHALKMVSPVRNALGTFEAQKAQVVISEQISDHLSQNRWTRKGFYEMQTLASKEDREELLAGCFVKRTPSPKKICRKCGREQGTYSPWLGLFGDYATGGAQRQTPSFEASSGGCIAAFDYNGICYPQPLGSAIAYAHTYIHEKGGFGHANVDIGAAGLYGTFTASKWYFDLSVLGGYYHIQNARNIEFPFFDGTAKSKTHGWQVAPHFEIGYDYLSFCKSENWFGIEPFAMIDWVGTWEHSLRERGTGGVFDFGQKGRWCSLLRSEGGFRFDEMLVCDWGTFTFREKGSYAYQKAFHTGSISSFLIGSPGSFNVTTLAGAQNLGVGELEFQFAPYCKKYPGASIAYQGEFGSKYQSNQVMITIVLDY